MLKEVGKISIPNGAMVEPHEYKIATILSWTGNDVEFIEVGTTPTPDIKFMGLEWEMKSPKGKSSRTVENNVREALRQSNNIIIDLSRIKLPENKGIREAERLAKLLGKKRKIMVITKNGKIHELFYPKIIDK